MSAPWYRKPLCWLGMCHTFRPESDDTGCWGECSICHRRVGFVDRATLRRYADEEAARQLYDSWSSQPGWVPWVERGNSLMQDKARRETAL